MTEIKSSTLFVASLVIYEDRFMHKLVVLLAMVATLGACAYNPAFYEETRMMDNTLHNKSMG